LPGFEVIDAKERNAVSRLFNESGVLIAHGLDSKRKKFHVREFEKNCSKYFKSNYCLAVSSGTAAIKIGLKALGVKPGDEVITQAFNFIATIEAILDCGAKPIIANVDYSLNMDPLVLKKLITKKTKVILPVHMLGTPAKMNEILKISKKYSIPVLEDNCEAIGGKYSNIYLGTIGDIGVFSFDYGKMITTGEGGMVLTNNRKLDKFCREYHDHGHQNNPKFPRGKDTKEIYGFNYRMTEMQGAIGKVQLLKLKRMIGNNKKRYNALEKSIKERFAIREIPDLSSGTFDTFIFYVKNKSLKSKILKILYSSGVGTKNLPDATEWHCSFYWDHALPRQQIKNSRYTKDLLDTAIAIPIWLSKSLNIYKKVAKQIISI
tara:strand:+ start:2090 stop:3217 length:1128 start_codon:yes stop_codon:yes gene_type:complete